ncbi:MAG: hypothetical protein KBE30_02110 [Desulfobacter sp.]|nr:hypothetical protein [Desulfobacter sp.]
MTSDKELLMARLVVTGNTGELEALTLAGKIGQDPPKQEERSGMKGKKETIEFLSTDATPDLDIDKDERVELDDKNSAPSRSQSVDNADPSVEQLPDALPNVSFGSFSLSSGRNAQDVVDHTHHQHPDAAEGFCHRFRIYI